MDTLASLGAALALFVGALALFGGRQRQPEQRTLSAIQHHECLGIVLVFDESLQHLELFIGAPSLSRNARANLAEERCWQAWEAQAW